MKDILNHREYGTGFPVVILHGLFGSLRNWMPVAKSLSELFRVAVPDARNHGESFWSDSMSYPQMADDVAQWMAAAGIRKAHLIGHSMGGKTAMTLALKRPERIGRLIVVDIAPVNYRNSFAETLSALAKLPLDGLRDRAEADDLLAADIPDGSLRTFLVGNLIKRGDRFRWRINLNGIAGNIGKITTFPHLSPNPFGAPVLFVKGEHSDYLAPRYFADIFRLFPEASIKAVPRSGHLPHIENPAACCQIIKEFFAED